MRWGLLPLLHYRRLTLSSIRREERCVDDRRRSVRSVVLLSMQTCIACSWKVVDQITFVRHFEPNNPLLIPSTITRCRPTTLQYSDGKIAMMRVRRRCIVVGRLAATKCIVGRRYYFKRDTIPFKQRIRSIKFCHADVSIS